MIRWALLLALCGAQAAQAQATGWRFRWQTGQVLTYRVEQQTQAAEVVGKSRIDTRSKMSLVKRWRVLAVDGSGVATLQHSMASLRIETTTPSGETLLFDSAHPEKSNSQMREQLGPLVGVPLATLRIDPYGRLAGVKESKFGPASRFEAELPFIVTLPGTAPQPGQTWQRNYHITLDPPAGTGEKYAAVQKFTCKRIEGTAAHLTMVTEMKSLPQALADQVPLLQLQPDGEVVFDRGAGRLHSARLHVLKELKNHQGEGSSYRFETTYVEQYASGE